MGERNCVIIAMIAKNRGVVAVILAATCVVAVVLIGQDTPNEVKEGFQGEPSAAQGMAESKAQWISNHKWVKKAASKAIANSDNNYVSEMAKENDEKYGVLTPNALRHNLHITEKETDDVNAKMDSEETVQKRKAALKKKALKKKNIGETLPQEKRDARREIKNMANEAFNKKTMGMPNRMAKIQRKMKKKLNKFRSKRQDKATQERHYKKACNSLKKIFENALPKNKAKFEATDCSGKDLF